MPENQTPEQSQQAQQPSKFGGLAAKALEDKGKKWDSADWALQQGQGQEGAQKS